MLWIAFLVIGSLLTLAFFGAGGAKLAGVPVMRESATHLGFSFGSYRVIGTLEVLGAIGVALGIIIAAPMAEWLGILAAAGLFALMLGAVVTHRSKGDAPGMWAPPLVLAALCAAYVALRLTAA